MKIIQQMEAFGESHHPAWLSSLRVLLGAIFFFKGVIFIQDSSTLAQMIRASQFPWFTFALVHYIVLAHLVGGILIFLGLVTRLAILFQIPILFGAVFLVNAPRGFFTGNGELLFSILILLLLIFFYFWGSGPYSVDQYMKTHKDR